MGVFMSTNAPNGLGDTVSMHVMDLLLGLEPWLNVTDVCSTHIHHDEASQAHSAERDNIPNQKDHTMPIGGLQHINHRKNEDYVGVYGHFGYGNVSVYINQSTGSLMMSYGPLAKWNLRVTDTEDVFDGIALEPLWYWTLNSLVFSKSNGTTFDLLDVPFDWSIPPTFRRDLNMASAPPPPELCPIT